MRLIEDFKAFFLRKEKRIADKNARGRVYAKRSGEDAPCGDHPSETKPEYKLKVRVQRAGQQEWETLDG